jgi:hypothetical protein
MLMRAYQILSAMWCNLLFLIISPELHMRNIWHRVPEVSKRWPRITKIIKQRLLFLRNAGKSNCGRVPRCGSMQAMHRRGERSQFLVSVKMFQLQYVEYGTHILGY